MAVVLLKKEAVFAVLDVRDSFVDRDLPPLPIGVHPAHRTDTLVSAGPLS